MKKEEIRKIYKEKREALSNEDIGEKSERIHHLIRSSLDLKNKRCSIFLPIRRQKEINTFLIIDDLALISTQFVVSKSDFSTREMTHFNYEGKRQLKENSWGIPEPTWGDQIHVNELDIVFVPLLAIDRKGHRVGYGKGFYDRFLVNCSSNCLFIGLSLFDEFVEIEDIRAGDIPMHVCITPNSIYYFDEKTPR